MSDLRHALRLFTRQSRFAAAVVLTLALTIGATSAMFGVVHAVLLRPLPYPDPDRLVAVWEVNARGRRIMPSDPNYEDIRDQGGVLAPAAQFTMMAMAAVVQDEPIRAAVAIVSGPFFDALGVAPAVGRGFLAEDRRRGAARVAIVSHAFWEQRLGRADLPNASMRIGNDPHAVVGVMPPGFAFPERADVWVPREQFAMRSGRTGRNSRVIARLKPGVTLDQARRDLTALAQRLKQQYGDDTWMSGVAVVPLREDLVGSASAPLGLLSAAVGFLLLVGAANVLNLLLAQIVRRQHEVAVRAALGAGRLRLVRQCIAETWLLTAAGSGLGLLIAGWTLGAIRALEPRALPRLQELTLGWPIVAFAALLSLVLALILGGVTAARVTTGRFWSAVRGGRTTSETAARGGVRGALVATQVALTLVLLVGAGLLTRSLLRLLDVDPGFRVDGVAVARLDLPPLPDAPLDDPGAADAAKSQRAARLDELVARAASLPGVTHAGLVSAFPLTTGGGDGTFAILRGERPRSFEDLRPLFRDPARAGYAEYRGATEGYFRAARIPLIRGRLFEPRDVAAAPHVAVISETLARTRWPHADPIGSQIEFGNMDGDLRPLTIVGVVGDVREEALHLPPQSIIYVCLRQRPQSGVSVAIHTRADAAGLAPSVRAAVRSLFPDAPVRFRTAEEVLREWLRDRRALLLLIGAFAVMALLLAITGVYGALAYALSQQMRELGIRAALGAARADLTRLVLRQAGVVVGAGLAAGIVAAYAAAGLLRAQLFGIGHHDAVTLAGASALLAIVALTASYLPARRASRVDPVIALRAE